MLGALAVAVLVALPVLGVVGHLASGGSADSIRHLMQTVLAEAVLTSLALGLLVIIGTVMVGTGAAWLVTQYEFPGRRWLTWALMLPLAMALVLRRLPLPKCIRRSTDGLIPRLLVLLCHKRSLAFTRRQQGHLGRSRIKALAIHSRKVVMDDATWRCVRGAAARLVMRG